jgi:predicted flavoprotein YhiN
MNDGRVRGPSASGVVGPGPAGLAAAVHASSEGLSTLIIDEFALVIRSVHESLRSRA